MAMSDACRMGKLTKMFLLVLILIVAGCALNLMIEPGNVTWTQRTIMPQRLDVNTSQSGYIVLNDFDLDGLTDAASAFASDDAVFLHIRRDNQVWTSQIISSGNGTIQSFASADLAGSTQPDIVAATGSGNILLLVAPAFSNTNEPFETSVFDNPQPVTRWTDVKIAQLDLAAGPEIVAVSPTSNIIGLWRTTSRPRTARDYQAFLAADLPNGNFERLSMADIDSNGVTDIVAVGPAGGVIWLENRGPANIVDSWQVFNVTDRLGFTRIVTFDVDQDGQIDVVCSNRTTGQVFWYENLGNPKANRWNEHLMADLSPGQPDALSFADIDENGRTDVVVGTEAPDGTIFWLRPQGEVRQLWQVRLIRDTGFEVGELPFGDLDGRNGIDFATTLAGSAAPVVVFTQN
jgi:hypothetical protein